MQLKYSFSNRRDKFQQYLREREIISSQLNDKGYYENNNTLYYLDNEGRLRHFKKRQPANDMIRIKILEFPYRWWQQRTHDVRHAIIPLFLGVSFVAILYFSANFFTEREQMMLEKARVDPEFTEEKLNQWKEEKEKGNKD